MSQVLLLVTDLIFRTKIVSTGQACGVSVRAFGNVDTIVREAASGEATLVLVDLNADCNATVAITNLLAVDATKRPRVVAYCSHVQKDLMQSARDAGADEVLARSAFVQRLPELLQSAVR